MKDRIVIDIQLDDIKNIKAAEREKAKLENDGYKLVYESAGFSNAMLIYEKE